MPNTYIGPSLGPAFGLKDLIGRERVRHMIPGEHPLGAGFKALQKRLIGHHELTVGEREALADLKMAAGVIMGCEPQWRDHRPRWSQLLANAKECEAILFEVEIIRFSLMGLVSRFEWPIFREGQRDIRVYGPDMWVECKLAPNPTSKRILGRARRAKNQPRDQRLPLVVAVGFRTISNPSEVDQVQREMLSKQKWFADRPEISALLIAFRTKEPVEGAYWNPLGLPGLNTHFGAVCEVRNQACANPIPSEFMFGDQQALPTREVTQP